MPESKAAAVERLSSALGPDFRRLLKKLFSEGVILSEAKDLLFAGTVAHSSLLLA
jgi:hypothetical protein